MPFSDGVWRFGHEPSGGFVGFDVAMDAAVMGDFVAMHAFLSTETSFRRGYVTVQRRVGRRLEILRGCTYTDRSADRARSRR